MSKKVLLLTDQLRVGGAETYFFKIENNLKCESVELITAAEDGEYRDKIVNGDRFIFLSKNPIKNMFKIARIARKEKVDVIHANSLRLSMMSLLAKFANKKKIELLYTKHNLTYLEKIHEKIFVLYVNLFIDKFLTVCDFEKDRMIKNGIKDKKIRVVYNSTDINEYKFKSNYIKNNSDELKIAILARLEEEKNHMFFLDIIEELQKSKLLKFKAYIAGDGTLKESIQSEVTKRKLNIEMLGNVPKPYELLKNIDVSLLVSHREVFPMSVIEALSVGSLVVSINVGAVSDSVINNKTGYLIEEYNCSKFVEVIKSIYNNREKNEKLIINGRKLVESKYSLQKMIEDIERVYLED